MKVIYQTVLIMLLGAASIVPMANASVGAPTVPEFMNQKQLAEWRQAQSSNSTAAQTSAGCFYTGKPYIASLDSYVFKFRNYNPAACRWQGADLFGFPDGPNNYMYSPTPTAQYDRLGAWRSGTPYGPLPSDTTDRLAAGGAPVYFNSLGETLSERAVSHLISGTTATISDIALTSAEQSAFEAASEFVKVENYVKLQLSSARGAPVTFNPASDMVFLTFSSGDLGHAIHQVWVTLDGTITPTYDSLVPEWVYNEPLTIGFSDIYNFSLGSNPLVNVFARLQFNGWTSAFNIADSWSVNFSGSFE